MLCFHCETVVCVYLLSLLSGHVSLIVVLHAV